MLCAHQQHLPVVSHALLAMILCRHTAGQLQSSAQPHCVKRAHACALCIVLACLDLQPRCAGADALKDALAKLGLKCGGTLRQRAERLILTKTTPLAQLDRKLFAKGVVPAVRPLPYASMNIYISFRQFDALITLQCLYFAVLLPLAMPNSVMHQSLQLCASWSVRFGPTCVVGSLCQP